MSVEDRLPFIFLAFANDRAEPAHYLGRLPEELRQVRARLDSAEGQRLCKVVFEPNITVDQLFNVFQDPRYRDRIAVFHFAGHAGDYRLLLESAEGHPELAHAEGLAGFLGHQQGLQFVFLNGCSTERQVEGLLEAGVRAVIATSDSILDSAAMELSVRFYTALAGGATLALAYGEAVDAVKSTKGGSTRDVYRDTPASDRWPWDLYPKEDVDGEREWSLRKAAGDHLFGLPSLPKRDLPEMPYRHLEWFREEDAELFFGRGREIHEVYDLVTSPSANPIVLFYGRSGVGKSSMLEAGLQPRLKKFHRVLSGRRRRDVGLTKTLTDTLNAEPGAGEPDSPVAAVWRAIEAKAGQPLVVILDQVEEYHTRPCADDPDELRGFMRVVREIFAEGPNRPQGKLVLAFRMEWLADIEARLTENKLVPSKYYLEPLDRDGIIEIVEGPAQSKRLRRHFRLTLEPRLAGVIADDLRADRGSVVAPMLEVLLTKMWKVNVGDDGRRTFTTLFYQEMHSKGRLLENYLDEEISKLHDWNPQVVDSGLALDLLAFHTTELGTAESRTRAEIDVRYPHQSAVLDELLHRSKASRLLSSYVLVDGEAPTQTDASVAQGTRLAHDTLAPLVRQRFKASDSPGQRARRILENRIGEWRDGKTGKPKTGNPLDETDLATVEQGEAGTQAWSSDEERLIQASRKRRAEDRRKRRAERWAWRVGAAAFATACLAAGYWGVHATQEAKRVRAVAILSSAAAQDDPLLAALMVGSLVGYPEPPRGAHIAAGLPRTVVPVALLAGHRGVVVSAAFSPDGRRVVTASWDSTARVWNADGTGLPVVLAGHADEVTSAAFSPDGRRVVTSSDDGTARVWNADGSGDTLVLRGHTSTVYSAAFSPDGRRIVTASADSTARVWYTDGSGDTVVLRGHAGEVTSAAFSPDGQRVVTTSDAGVARVWNADGSGKVVVLAGHIHSAAFSPDGERVVCSSLDGTARVWNANGSGNPTVFTNSGAGAAFSPDGRRLVTTHMPDTSFSLGWGDTPSPARLADDTVRVWNADGSGVPLKLAVHTQPLRVAFSPDGLRILIESQDTVQVWNADGSDAPVVLAGHAGWCCLSARFSPDGRQVVTALDSAARVWNIDGSGAPMVLSRHTKDSVTTAVLSPDGRRVLTASADGTARVWDTEGLGVPLELGHVSGSSFSPDGQWVVVASADSTARVWNADGSGTPVVLAGHRDVVTSAAFSLDGQRVVTASADSTARVWNADGSGTPKVLAGHRGKVWSAAFSPNRRRVVTFSGEDTYLSYSYNGGVQTISGEWTALVWNADGSGTPVELGRVDSVRFAPDDKRLIVHSPADGTSEVWNADGSGARLKLGGVVWFSRDGQRVFTSAGDRVRVWNADGSSAEVRPGFSGRVEGFSPDGRRVVSLSDSTAWVWNADGSGKLVALSEHTKGSNQVRSAAFSPDGRRILTAYFDDWDRIWNADRSGRPVVLDGCDGSARFSPDGQRVVTTSWAWVSMCNTDGSGEPVVLRDSGAIALGFRPDGRVVTVNRRDGAIRIWLVTWESLVDYFRSSTTACLTPEQRGRLLAESVKEARAQYEKCEHRHGRPG